LFYDLYPFQGTFAHCLAKNSFSSFKNSALPSSSLLGSYKNYSVGSAILAPGAKYTFARSSNKLLGTTKKTLCNYRKLSTIKCK